MVGSVRNMSTTATNVSYEIGDGTGYIDARVWLDSADDESGKTTGIEYVHISHITCFLVLIIWQAGSLCWAYGHNQSIWRQKARVCDPHPAYNRRQ